MLWRWLVVVAIVLTIIVTPSSTSNENAVTSSLSFFSIVEDSLPRIFAHLNRPTISYPLVSAVYDWLLRVPISFKNHAGKGIVHGCYNWYTNVSIPPPSALQYHSTSRTIKTTAMPPNRTTNKSHGIIRGQVAIAVRAKAQPPALPLISLYCKAATLSSASITSKPAAELLKKDHHKFA